MSHERRRRPRGRALLRGAWRKDDPWAFDTSPWEAGPSRPPARPARGSTLSRALELGCGAGHFTRAAAAPRGCRVGSRHLARPRSRRRGACSRSSTAARAELRVANVMDADLRTEAPFDLVVLSGDRGYYLGWLYPFFRVAWLARDLYEVTSPAVGCSSPIPWARSATPSCCRGSCAATTTSSATRASRPSARRPSGARRTAWRSRSSFPFSGSPDHPQRREVVARGDGQGCAGGRVASRPPTRTARRPGTGVFGHGQEAHHEARSRDGRALSRPEVEVSIEGYLGRGGGAAPARGEREDGEDDSRPRSSRGRDQGGRRRRAPPDGPPGARPPAAATWRSRGPWPRAAPRGVPPRRCGPPRARGSGRRA